MLFVFVERTVHTYLYTCALISYAIHMWAADVSSIFIKVLQHDIFISWLSNLWQSVRRLLTSRNQTFGTPADSAIILFDFYAVWFCRSSDVSCFFFVVFVEEKNTLGKPSPKRGRKLSMTISFFMEATQLSAPRWKYMFPVSVVPRINPLFGEFWKNKPRLLRASSK